MGHSSLCLQQLLLVKMPEQREPCSHAEPPPPPCGGREMRRCTSSRLLLAHPSPWGQRPLAHPIPSVLLIAGGRRSHNRLGSPEEPPRAAVREEGETALLPSLSSPSSCSSAVCSCSAPALFAAAVVSPAWPQLLKSMGRDQSPAAPGSAEVSVSIWAVVVIISSVIAAAPGGSSAGWHGAVLGTGGEQELLC